MEIQFLFVELPNFRKMNIVECLLRGGNIPLTGWYDNEDFMDLDQNRPFSRVLGLISRVFESGPVLGKI